MRIKNHKLRIYRTPDILVIDNFGRRTIWLNKRRCTVSCSPDSCSPIQTRRSNNRREVLIQQVSNYRVSNCHGFRTGHLRLRFFFKFSKIELQDRSHIASSFLVQSQYQSGPGKFWLVVFISVFIFYSYLFLFSAAYNI